MIYFSSSKAAVFRLSYSLSFKPREWWGLECNLESGRRVDGLTSNDSSVYIVQFKYQCVKGRLGSVSSSPYVHLIPVKAD